MVWVFVVHGGLEVGFDCGWCWVLWDVVGVCLAPFGDVVDCGVVFVVEGVYLFAECVDLVLGLPANCGHVVELPSG